MSSDALPQVSIVIPAYNCAAFICEAIESVLAQNYANKEIIVVDDGSTDTTAETVSGFGDAVHLIRQPNRGPAAARNRGVADARGAYVAFLDGDDVWLPGKLATQMSYMKAHSDTRIVFSGFARWFQRSDGTYPPSTQWAARGAQDVIGSNYDGYLYPVLLLDSIVCIITTVVERSVFSRVGGFDESLKVGEDYDFWIRASRHFKAHKVDNVLALYRMRPQSATRNVPRPLSSEYLVLRRAIERFGLTGPDGQRVDEALLRSRMATLCFAHGYRHFWEGDLRIAAESFRQTLRHTRLAPRAVAYAIATQMRILFSSRQKAES